MLRKVALAVFLGAATVGSGVVVAGAGPGSTGSEIPGPFAPFEYLIGSWKGTGIPSVNRVKGWNESHSWAWKFEKGSPVGLSVAMDGSKILQKGQLSFDAATKRYKLEGKDAESKPVVLFGALDKAGKNLILERVGPASDGAKQRLMLFPNSNLIRYTIWVDHQEPGAPQFKRALTIGLTKEGEAFAAGSSATEAPKCIVTGGAAALSVTYQGKSFPLCCTGCRDEFNENPEKYVKKAALLAAPGGKAAAKPGSPATGKDDGAFEGLAGPPKRP
jgi:YHS domain-containing protein